MGEHDELTEIDDGDEKLLETVPLTPKELAFCEAFGNPESETFGNATASGAAAGFIQPRSAGWKLRRRGRIIAKLKSYHTAVTVAVGRVLADLENERRLAVEKGDIASAIRATELMGKHLAMFTDVLATDIPDAPRYDARIAAEASRITAFLLLNPASDSPLALPAPPAVIEQKQPRPVPTLADIQALERARNESETCDP